MPQQLAADLALEWREILAPWCRLWQVPGLKDQLQLSVSARLRTSLARCMPARRQIRIASFLLDASPALMREVLCHEAAHAAVAELHPDYTRPHGAEWRSLMRTAGFEPRTRVPASAARPPGERHLEMRPRWEHRCPVCQARRLAGRPVPQWRCRACVEAGLDGALLITRLRRQGDARR